MSIWDDLDKTVDLEGLQEDIEKAAEGTGEYKEVPVGKYEVSFEKLELVKSKKDKPMVSGWMKILEGDFKGSILFYNQVIDQAFGIHNANEFLRSLGSKQEVTFKSFSQYALLLDAIKLYCDDCEFAVEYSKNSKDYNVYEITDIYELD